MILVKIDTYNNMIPVKINMYNTYRKIREIVSYDVKTIAMRNIMDKVDYNIGSMTHVTYYTIKGRYYDIS